MKEYKDLIILSIVATIAVILGTLLAEYLI
jgi:hypothetical protein